LTRHIKLHTVVLCIFSVILVRSLTNSFYVLGVKVQWGRMEWYCIKEGSGYKKHIEKDICRKDVYRKEICRNHTEKLYDLDF